MDREKLASNYTQSEHGRPLIPSERRAHPAPNVPTQITDGDPSPGEVRRAILREHASIRRMLHRLETEATLLLSASVPEPATWAHTRELALQLCTEMTAHVGRENQFLIPVLARIDAWGPVRAQQLLEEHTRQLMLLDAYTDMFSDEDVTAQALALAAWQIVITIRDDMGEEEDTILTSSLLSDDGICDDVETG